MNRIKSTVQSLQEIYAIVIALAIAEAFIQFVPDPKSSCEQAGIQWEQLLPLVSLLILVVPFYHGMTRFLSEMYQKGRVNNFYGVWLFLDCCVFTIEAVLFFILARSLPKVLWFRFYSTVMALLVLDISWGMLTWCCRTSLIRFWVIVNLCTIPFLGVLLLMCRNSTSWWAISLAFLLVLARTIADYWTSWELYFPKL
jgi:hypothetical protein